MSTHITPGSRATPRDASRSRTAPQHSRPAPPSPFRWSPEFPTRQSTHADEPAGAGVPEHRPDLPDAQAWAAILARAIVEVVTGARQAPQLRRWLLPELYTALAGVHLTPCARATTPIHVRTCAIDARHTEAAVIVSTASRTFALALRLEEYRGRWVATALELA